MAQKGNVIVHFVALQWILIYTTRENTRYCYNSCFQIKFIIVLYCEICGEERWESMRKRTQLFFIIISCQHTTTKIYKAKNKSMSQCADNFPVTCRSIFTLSTMLCVSEGRSLKTLASGLFVFGFQLGSRNGIHWMEDKKRQKVDYWFLHLPPSRQGGKVTVFTHPRPQLLFFRVLYTDPLNLASFNPRVGNGIYYC